MIPIYVYFFIYDTYSVIRFKIAKFQTPYQIIRCNRTDVSRETSNRLCIFKHVYNSFQLIFVVALNLDYVIFSGNIDDDFCT